MKTTITISKNNSTEEISVYDNSGVFIRRVEKKIKTPKGYVTDEVDIRELKIGDKLDGGIVTYNPYL